MESTSLPRGLTIPAILGIQISLRMNIFWSQGENASDVLDREKIRVVRPSEYLAFQ